MEGPFFYLCQVLYGTYDKSRSIEDDLVAARLFPFKAQQKAAGVSRDRGERVPCTFHIPTFPQSLSQSLNGDFKQRMYIVLYYYYHRTTVRVSHGSDLLALCPKFIPIKVTGGLV